MWETGRRSEDPLLDLHAHILQEWQQKQYRIIPLWLNVNAASHFVLTLVNATLSSLTVSESNTDSNCKDAQGMGEWRIIRTHSDTPY